MSGGGGRGRARARDGSHALRHDRDGDLPWLLLAAALGFAVAAGCALALLEAVRLAVSLVCGALADVLAAM